MTQEAQIEAPREKKILFVRSGGGLPGLDIHAGISLALENAGICCTHTCGTSAGAIIAGLDAAGYTAEQIAGIIERLDDRQVRQERFAWRMRIPFIDNWLSHSPIRELLEGLLHPDVMFGKFLSVTATGTKSGSKVTFDFARGARRDDMDVDPVDAIMASMSIHGVFPTVTINDMELADGGVRANLPLPSYWKSFDEVWLLIATPPTEYHNRHGILSRLLLNVAWLMRDQIEDVLEETRGAPNVRVIWPKVGTTRGALRFDHSLIPLAYREARTAIWKINEEKTHKEQAS